MVHGIHWHTESSKQYQESQLKVSPTSHFESTREVISIAHLTSQKSSFIDRERFVVILRAT